MIVEHPTNIKRVAVYHLNGVGDLLFSLPALLALRQAYPAAHLTSIIRPYLRDLLEPAGLADEILTRPRRDSKRDFWPFLRALRNGRFDLAVLFSQSASANIYARLSGAKIRVGFIDTIYPRLLSHILDRRGITCTAKLLWLVEQLGASPEKRDYVGLLKTSEQQQARAKNLLEQAGLATPLATSGEPFAVFAFAEGAGRPYAYKTWPREKFAAVGKRLLADGLRPVIIGARGDAEEALLLAEAIGSGAISLAGKTNLGELAAVLQQARLLIGIDSGPTHIAAALGVPVVALFGPTDPTVTGPQGDSCIILRKQTACAPCVKPTCEGRPCMTAIRVEEVLEAAEKLVRGPQSAICSP